MKPTVSFFQRLKRSRDLLYIVILALVVALVWIVLSVYHSSVKTSITADVQALTKPLNPAIDTDLIGSLSTRTVFSNDELASFPINREIVTPQGTTASPAPAAEPSPVPTPAAVTPVASGSAKETPSPAPSSATTP